MLVMPPAPSSKLDTAARCAGLALWLAFCVPSSVREAAGQQARQTAENPLSPGQPSPACELPGQIPSELQNPKETVTVSADFQEKEHDVSHLRGHVVVTYRDLKLTADQATYDDTSKEVVAQGHVTLTDPEGHMGADEAHYNVLTGQGWFSKAHGSIKARVRKRARVLTTDSPLYVQAARVERLGPATYTVKNARLTSCSFQTVGWTVGARSARLEVGDKIVSHWADFRLLKVPLLYSPLLIHSVANNPRQTGFLLPHLGNSSQKGFIFGEGFFWAINPSADLLLGLENFTVRGLGGVGRFRARPSANSDIGIDYFGVDDRGGGPLRQNRAPGQTIRAVGRTSDLFQGFRGVLDVDYVSSLAFRQTFTDSFSEAVISEARQTGFMTKTFDAYNVNFYVSRYQNFLCASRGQNCPFPPNVADSISIRQSPSVSVGRMDKQVGRSALYFSFDASAAGVSRTEPGFATPRLTERVDFFPNLLMRSKPFLGLHVTPSVGVRATRYGTSLRPDRGPIDRFLGQLSIDLQPPPLEKVFPKTYGGYRLKHVVEPDVRYRLVRSFNRDDLRDVVRYDSVDIFSETSELEYSLTNSLFIRKGVPAETGEKPQARELLSLRVSQKYYFDPTFGNALQLGRNSVFEPTISLSGFAFAQGRRLSPIVSVLKLSPFANYDTEISADINPSGGGVRDVGITSYLHRGRIGVAMTEFFINANSVLLAPAGQISPTGLAAPAPRAPSFNLLRTVVTYGDVNRKGFSGALGLVYNLDQRIAHQIVSQVSYNFGCFAVDFEYGRFALGSVRRENQFRIALSLANIGSFGNLKPRERLY